MKILFISNLLPDVSEPGRGLHNARLMHALGREAEIRALVLRPGLRGFLSGRNGRAGGREEDSAFRPVVLPVPQVPRIGSQWNHRLIAWRLAPAIRKIRESFSFDVILAAWLYPDACAVAIVALDLKIPFVAVAQGSDAHQYLNHPVRRRLIVDMARQASALVTRSRDLERLVKEAAGDLCRASTIYNGVETDVFHPGDKSQARRTLGMDENARVILYVGNFHAIKDPLLLVRAFARLKNPAGKRDFRLVMIGDGSLRQDAVRLASREGVGEAVTFSGFLPPGKVADWMRAADVLCIPSRNEGVPNVAREALASGLPVVGAKVGGVPEVVTSDDLGLLVDSRDPETWARMLERALEHPWSRETLARHAEQFSWERTAGSYLKILERAVAVHGSECSD